jgi:hypothetical protein
MIESPANEAHEQPDHLRMPDLRQPTDRPGPPRYHRNVAWEALHRAKRRNRRMSQEVGNVKAADGVSWQGENCIECPSIAPDGHIELGGSAIGVQTEAAYQ